MPENNEHINNDQIDAIWNSNEYLSLFEQVNIDKRWSEIESLLDAKSSPVQIKTPIIRNLYFRIAAASVILVFVSLLYYFINHDFNNERIFANVIQEVILPDGSSVMLNANSSLVYPKTFNDNSRSIKLEGEAFFEVEKDSLRPFVVDVNETSVKVLGTSFNIDATDPSKMFVNVVTGSVRLFETKNKNNFIDLDARSQGIFNFDTKVLIYKSDLNKNKFSWKTDTLIFSQAPLSDVFLDFKKYFKKEFTTTNVNINKFRLSSKFCNPDLGDVLSEICELYDLDCNISKDTVYFYKK